MVDKLHDPLCDQLFNAILSLKSREDFFLHSFLLMPGITSL